MTEPKRYRTALLLALLALFLLGGTVWAFRFRQREKQVEEITDKGSELADEVVERMSAIVDEAAKKRPISPAQFLAMQDEFRARFEEQRKELEKLPPDQQERVGREVQKKMRKKFEKMAADFLQKPKEEQNLIIDGLLTLGDLARNNPRGNSDGRGGMMMGGGPGQGRSLSPEERDRRRREFLDNSTPSERATFSGAMQLIEQRRRERGLPAR